MTFQRSLLISAAPPVFCLGALVFLSILTQQLGPAISSWAHAALDALDCGSPRSALRVTSELSLFYELRETLRLQACSGRHILLAPVEHRALGLGMAAVVALGASLALSWRIGVNEFSLHALYRNRLVRCYLGAVRGDDRHADLFTGFDAADDSIRVDELTAYHGERPKEQPPLRPYMLVNATLNLVVGQRLSWQFRRASSFVFTPLFSGYETRNPVQPEGDCQPRDGLYDSGYRETARYGGGITLGTAMAISGAALSPNMGARTSPAMAFLMTLFNVRLGWWLGNPRHQTTWSRPGPLLGLIHLLVELLGRATDNRKYVYLSDGGHFENLGLYELVRRNCRYIIVSDASEDHDFAFADLGNAIEKCRVDFGVEIEIDLSLLQRDPATRRSKAHYAVGQIRYDLAGRAEAGTLVYLKSSLVGREPVDVQTYAHANPHFPHQSTRDQWFDEAQFESYRALGEHITLDVLDLHHSGKAYHGGTESLFEDLPRGPPLPAPRSEPATAMTSGSPRGRLNEDRPRDGRPARTRRTR